MWSKGEFAQALKEETAENRRATAMHELREMVDRLGPNVWVMLDEVAVGRYFGNGESGWEAAKSFAMDAGCVVVIAPDKRSLKFGRAYYKRA
jgi:hypothetical protein